MSSRYGPTSTSINVPCLILQCTRNCFSKSNCFPEAVQQNSLVVCQKASVIKKLCEEFMVPSPLKLMNMHSNTIMNVNWAWNYGRNLHSM